MNDLLNQLVGLCAGRGALLRLERRQLLEEFRTLPDNHEYKDSCRSDCQLCREVVNPSTDAGNGYGTQGFLKTREQPNDGNTFRYSPQSSRTDENADVFDPYELLRIRPIPARSRCQQAQQLQKSTIPPTWSGEHRTSFPSLALHAPSALSRSDSYRTSRGQKDPVKRVPDANSDEAFGVSHRGDRLPRAVTDSHRFHILATMDRNEKGVSLRRRNSTYVCLDKFEANMKSLTIKLTRERRLRREIILGGPENRYRVRVEVDAEGTLPEELEQARQSTTFRADYGLQYQYPDAGRVDIYKNAHAMKSRRWYHGWVGR